MEKYNNILPFTDRKKPVKGDIRINTGDTPGIDLRVDHPDYDMIFVTCDDLDTGTELYNRGISLLKENRKMLELSAGADGFIHFGYERGGKRP